MALQKSVLQPSGATATYHKITTGTVDFLTGATSISLASYLDKAARDAGKAPLAASDTTFPTPPPVGTDYRAWAYDQLKSTGGWSDATDA